ncbi:MAG: macro domain-containing protein [Betaproteobacteria bacterium]
MSITYVKGDLFSTPHNVLVHGCNTHGVMGSGVAKIVKDKYPEVFEKYAQVCKPWKNNRAILLGTNVYARTQNDQRVIVNAITQLDMGPPPTRWVSYDAVDDCMAALANDLEASFEHGLGAAIAMPMIGAGLGGGDWKVIEAIIERRLKDFAVTVYVL